MKMYDLVRPFMFGFDPEEAHLAVESVLHRSSHLPFALSLLQKMSYHDDVLSQEILGMKFSNPVGLGAGFDKNATMARALVAMGLGYIEVGTITPKPQEGNPKPRIFRYPELESVQNAMGFNNDGMETILSRVSDLYPMNVPLGVNIGKNKVTTEEMALKDYTVQINAFKDVCDYLTINISSPNTVGLRDLQNESFIQELFGEAKKITHKPIFLKIAPDMDHKAAIALSQMAITSGASGIIATNTTVDYSLVPHPQPTGGLSGKVLTEKSFALFDALAQELYGHTTLISVGGIDSAQEAYRRILAGASLVQVYTGLIFQGPSLFGEINKGLAALLKADGFGSISDAVGAKRR